METRVFERDGKTWTRFKVKVKELRIYALGLFQPAHEVLIKDMDVTTHRIVSNQPN